MHHSHRDSPEGAHAKSLIYMGFRLNLFAPFLCALVIQLFVKLSCCPSSEFRLFVALEEYCVWLIVLRYLHCLEYQRLTDVKLKVIEETCLYDCNLCPQCLKR